jgi:hypothetical protein
MTVAKQHGVKLSQVEAQLFGEAAGRAQGDASIEANSRALSATTSRNERAIAGGATGESMKLHGSSLTASSVELQYAHGIRNQMVLAP